jgi:hypothetical protein
MSGADRLWGISSTIQSIVSSSSRRLMSAPEIEPDTQRGVVRKLQVQVLALTDALVDAADVIGRLEHRAAVLGARLG